MPLSATRRSLLMTAAILALLTMTAGCATVSKVAKLPGKIVHSVRGNDSGLVKIVAFTPFFDTTFVRAQGMAVSFEKHLIEQFRKQCPKTIVLTPDDPEFPRDLRRLPTLASGAMDDFTLARTGRRLGLNAIVAGGVLNISGDWKEKGFWWFKDKKPEIKIALLVSVYDTETGSKILDESLVHSFLVDENDLEAIKAKNDSGIQIMKEALAGVAKDLTETACQRLGELPWKCYVKGISGDSITLSAGSRSGLQAGKELSVYAQGEILEGVGGLKYIRRGEKVADIKVTAVAGDSAEARIIAGEGVRAGDVALPR